MDTYEGRMADQFRALLMQRAGQLREVLEHETQAASADDPHEVGDFKDAAAEESIASVDMAQAAQAAGELTQVRDALRRITDGTYGECVDCGDPIDLRRLQALPATAYCASCQSVHERERH